MPSPSILNPGKISEDQFIADLTSLFRRRNISFGQPQDLERLASHLSSDDAFRGGLFNLCAVISHMSEVELTPPQLLLLVARASGGQGIFDAEGHPVIPHDTERAFLAGYEAWSKREPDLDAYLDRRHHEPFHAAMALSSAEGFRDTPGHPAGPPSTPRPIPSNAPLDSLTLGELRQYLDDIERRVSRIEPHLEQVQAEPLAESIHPLVERNAAETAHGESVPPQAARIEPVLAVPALTAVAITPVQPPQPAMQLHATNARLFADFSPPESDEKAAASAARVRRLRIANSILATLLVISAVFAAFVAVRYLKSRPINFGATVASPSAPSVEFTPQSTPLPSQAKPATSVPHTTPITGAILLPPQVPKNPSGPDPLPDAIIFPESLAPPEIKPPAPVILQAPAPTPAPMIPAPPPPQVAEARLATPTPAPATAPRSIPTAQPPSAPLSVPSSRMIAYAIASPAPAPPRNRHGILDSTVEVMATISKEGKVVNVRALSGPNDVRPAAVEAMKAWRFRPYLVDGKPVEVVTTLKFLFKAQ